MPLSFYAGLAGAIISTLGVIYLALTSHDPTNPLTVSQVVSQKKKDLNLFRATIWVGGSLIASTMFLFIVPRIKYPLLAFISFVMIYVSELLLSIFPDDHRKKSLIHYAFAYSMGIGMLGAAAIFSRALYNPYGNIELGFLGLMLILGLMTFVDNKRFMYYEMAFIGLSHVTVLLAATALK